MDFSQLLNIAQIAAPIAGGIAGQRAGEAGTSAASDDLNAIAAAYNIPLPDIEKMRLNLEQQQVAGTLNPNLEQNINLGDTALSNIQLDPEQNQMLVSALRKMSDVSQQGLPEVDRAQINSLLNQTAQQNQAQQKSILENRAARGMGGSGNELAAQLAASQGGANAASQNALQVGALAAQRKLDATSNLANMVNTAQNADYQRQANLQGQRDAIAQFNAQQNTGTQQRNVAAQNLAQQMNLGNAQNISNTNTDTRNQQQQYNKQLEQQNFNNAMQRAGGITSSRSAAMAGHQGQADAAAGSAMGTASGIAGALGSLSKLPSSSSGGSSGGDLFSGLSSLFSGPTSVGGSGGIGASRMK